MTFLEITQRQFWFMGPCFKSYLSYKFDQSETIHEEFGQSSCLETLRKSFQALIFLKLSADHLIIYNGIMSSGFFKFCHRGYNRVILLSYVLFAPNITMGFVHSLIALLLLFAKNNWRGLY